MRAGEERWAPTGGADRHSSGGKKKEGHTSAPTCQWRTGPANVTSSRLGGEKSLNQNVSWVVPDNLGILVLPSLWSKVTSSISLSLSSHFHLVKGKKKTKQIDQVWNLVDFEELNSDLVIDFCLFAKSLPHLELCDSPFLWLTSRLASRVLGFIAHPRVLVLAIVNFYLCLTGMLAAAAGCCSCV